MTQRYVVCEIFTRSRVVVAATAEEALAMTAPPDGWPQVALSGRHAVPVDVQPDPCDPDVSIWQPGKSPTDQPAGQQ